MIMWRSYVHNVMEKKRGFYEKKMVSAYCLDDEKKKNRMEER